MVAHEGGHDACSDSSGFSRKRKRRENETISPCEPGENKFHLKDKLRQAVYASGKSMHFQSQLGQTKAVVHNQVNNEMQCVEFD